MTQDEMVGWHHRLDGLSKLRELGMDTDGQGWTGKPGVLQSVRSQSAGHD